MTANALSPVETLRAAAAQLRSEPTDPWWWNGPVHPDVAGPLAEWLESEAMCCQVLGVAPSAHRTRLALTVARVLLGVPDGR